MTTSADVSLAFLPKTITNEEMKCRRQQMLKTLQNRINADKSRGIEYMKNKWGHSLEDRSGHSSPPQQKCDFNNGPNFVEMWGNGQTKKGENKILMHEHGGRLRDKNTEEVRVQSTPRIKISAETLRAIQELKSRVQSQVEEKPLTSCDLNVNSDVVSVEIPSKIITDEEINSRRQQILDTLQNRMKVLPKQDKVHHPIPERPKWDFDNSPGSFIELDGQIFKKTPLTDHPPAKAAEEIEISEQEQDKITEEFKVQPKSGIKVSTEILQKIQELKSRIKSEVEGKPLKNCAEGLSNDVISIKNNIKNHGGDADLNECPFCSKKYHFKSSFEIHLRRHTRERPFICSLCSSGYRQRRDLNNHALRVHGWTPENIVKRRQKRGRGRPRKNCDDLDLGLYGSSNGLVRLTRIRKFI